MGASTALVGSQVTLKTDAGVADPAAYCAGKPSHLLRSELVDDVCVCWHAIRAPTTAVCSAGLQNFRCDFELLEYGLDLTFCGAFDLYPFPHQWSSPYCPLTLHPRFYQIRVLHHALRSVNATTSPLHPPLNAARAVDDQLSVADSNHLTPRTALQMLLEPWTVNYPWPDSNHLTPCPPLEMWQEFVTVNSACPEVSPPHLARTSSCVPRLPHLHSHRIMRLAATWRTV